MATVTLTDIYEPLTFEKLIDEQAVTKNGFIASGVIVEDARLTAQAQAGGRIGDMPNYAPISTAAEPNYSSDDPASTSTPKNIASQTQKWRLAAMNDSWSAMDLSRELALSDPITAITSGIGGFWATQEQKRLINTAMGVLADNVANDSEDMLYDIATDSADAVTAAEKISAEAVILAAATNGDRMDSFSAIAVHSVVYTTMRINNLLDVIMDSDNKPIEYFGKMRVIVDDGLSAAAGSNRVIYTSILFKAGAFSQGNGVVEQPSELERKAATGDGGGETILHSRRSRIIHPWGCSFLSATVTDDSPNLANLLLAVNWNRIYERKNIGLAFLQTNG